MPSCCDPLNACSTQREAVELALKESHHDKGIALQERANGLGNHKTNHY